MAPGYVTDDGMHGPWQYLGLPVPLGEDGASWRTGQDDESALV